ncbi:hypothetical protein BC827DRAFT_470818 [Russula dissimulans]|nr:hypothetical protein BC827DRAFT_470818 [Russula dissimulans]
MQISSLTDSAHILFQHQCSHQMPKQCSRPYRLGYRNESPYPGKNGMLLPSHGAGPRCRVDYDPNDDGPWTMVEIMRVDGDATENYTCALPSHYAVPLILLNKRLAFFEAQCQPDGTPLSVQVPARKKEAGSSSSSSSSPSWKSAMMKRHEMREYAYLWRLRSRFLQAVYDMNHDRRLDDRWQYHGLHGYMYRLYRRYGHDTYQRHAYWRGEIKEGRTPYADPDIVKMDWKAYLVEDLTTGVGMNAFLWNRVSQGFSPIMEDAPPQESWGAWSWGHRDHKLSEVPYRTVPIPIPALVSESSSSPAPRELRGELGAAAAAAAAAGPERRQTRAYRRHADPHLAESASAGGAATGTALAGTASSSRGGAVSTSASAAAAAATAVAADVGAMMVAKKRPAAGTTKVQAGAAAAVLAASSLSSSGTTVRKGPAGAGYCASIGDEGEDEVVEEGEEDGDGHDDDPDSDMDYEDVLTADLSGPPQSREWALPFPRSRSEQTSPEASQARLRSLRPRQISFKINAPDDLELTVIHCTFSRMEDVGRNCKPKLKVAYASKPSNSQSQARSESRRQR